MITRERLCVDLGPAKGRWEAWCAARSVTAADGVRQLVHGALAQDESSAPIADHVPGRSLLHGHRERVEIRLTQEELEAARQHAGAGGMNVNRWLVAVIRAQLVHEPQLGEREMRLLADSNQQMATLIVLLGRLQARGDSGDARRVVETARSVIDAHLRAVTQLLRANLDRWSR
ncbi:plasmid stabilization protein [Paraburkholderia tropica]|uniref:plasmid stabilization protein n=1 Tax=Paraburkholderia tropica TaxID=92647 RepID=UPI0030177356